MSTEKLQKVSPNKFAKVVKKIVKINDRFKENIDIKKDYSSYDCFLSKNATYGFCVNKETKEMCNVFSVEKGHGDSIMKFATKQFSKLKANCFDGYVKKLYERFGFNEAKREPNHNKDKPDVVFMEYIKKSLQR